MTARILPARLYTQDCPQDTTVTVCTEQTYRIFIDAVFITERTTTPTDLEALGTGLAITSGRSRAVKAVWVHCDEIHVTTAQAAATTAMPEIRLRPAFIRHSLTQLVSALWQETGGAHGAALFQDEVPISKAEDIGRHNAVDKAIGQAVMKGFSPSACVLACTGRLPADMLQKAVNSGIRAVISKTVPTAGGIELASKAGITLIGRVREDSFLVYCGFERISAD